MSKDSSSSKYEDYTRIINDAYDFFVYCHCDYSWKEEVKEAGFTWYPKLKLWRIRADKFSFGGYEHIMAPKYTNNTSIGEIHYYYVHFISSADIQSKLNNKEQYFEKLNYKNKQVIKKYSEEMAELGKRQEIKSNKYLKVKATKKKTPPPENAEEFGAGYYIVDN